MPKKKVTRKAVKPSKRVVAAKPSTWMSLYKWAIGAVVIMTLVAVGAMIWKNYTLQKYLTEVVDYEGEITNSSTTDINLIDSPRGGQGGLPVCGSSVDTKGACKTMQLTKSLSNGLACQALNSVGVAAGAGGKQQCYQAALKYAMMGVAAPWRAAMLNECQPGLLYDQKSITSSFLYSGNKQHTSGTVSESKNISVDGMHKCVPGLAGRKCRVAKGSPWVDCITAPYKGACKYQEEEVVVTKDGKKGYLFCAPTNQAGVEDSTSCYTGSAARPTVKQCCREGMVISGGTCAMPQ